MKLEDNWAFRCIVATLLLGASPCLAAPRVPAEARPPAPASATRIDIVTYEQRDPGVISLPAGITEALEGAVAPSWRWLHGLLAVLFIVVGVMAFMEPFQTFGILALLIGWYLVFKGIVDIVVSAVYREVLPLWGLALAAGIAEVVIGVWALGYPGRSAWLLVLWIGIGALVRGITEIVLAFQLRGARTA